MKKNGVYIFVISHIVPEIFTIFVLCKLGTDDVIRCDSMEVKTQNRGYYTVARRYEFYVRVARTISHE